MTTSLYVGFALGDVNYALTLASVERVVDAVWVTPLPDAPNVILGVINVQGQIVPVVDIRQRFGLIARDIGCDDKLIIAKSLSGRLALIADTVVGVVEYADTDIIAGESIVPGMVYTDAIAKNHDGVVLIHDLDKFLSLNEEASLQRVLGHD